MADEILAKGLFVQARVFRITLRVTAPSRVPWNSTRGGRTTR